jgi:adenylate kinase family enzyme
MVSNEDDIANMLSGRGRCPSNTGVGMGVRNYLIEGVSGAGKTTVATELQRRGYQAIHGDRELAYRGDPETGAPMAPETGDGTVAWLSEHHIWDVEKVRALVADQDEPVTFFCGGSRNFAKFIDLFDGVFVLEVDRDTMNRRIDERVALDPTDFGGKPEERDLIERLHATKEDVPKNAVSIDATAPIARVVDDILSKCRVLGS